MATPLQAIRQKCRWCSLDQAQEIQLCRSERSCPLWPLRFRKRVPGLSRFKAIRAKCLDCVGGSHKDAQDCDPNSDKCPLWLFRFGTNPNISEPTRQKHRGAIFNSLRKNADPRAVSDTNAERAV